MVMGHPRHRLAWLLLAATAVLIFFAAAARVATAASSDESGKGLPAARPPLAGGGALQPPDSPGNDPYLEIVPAYNAPDTGGTVTVGQRFVLELWLNAGSHTDITSYQAYLTFTNQTLQNARVDHIATTCSPSATLTGDYAVFDGALQNEVCNGPGTCLFRGVNVNPGTMAFSSGALFKCHDGCGGTFRVAEIGLCAVAPGQGLLKWQFGDKNLQRGTQIIDVENRGVENRVFFYDYSVRVLSPAHSTPNPISTPGDPTSSPTQITVNEPPPSVPPAATQPPTVEPDCLNGFVDVHSTDYFSTAVRFLYCTGSVTGYHDGTFRPYNVTSRGQLAKMIVLASGWTMNMAGGPHFVDLPAGSPFYPYIETASNRGIITGYADGTFRPDDKVTRGQLTKVVALSQGWHLDTWGGSHFIDVPIGHPFYPYIETAYRKGIITGYGDGTFRATLTASRGQITKVIYNALTIP